jgi:hypothetical protein
MKNPEYLLVHGIITDNKFGTNKSLDHAWVEKDGEVYDPVTDIRMPKEVYYNLYSAEAVAIYTFEEMIEIALKEGTYGVWDQKLKEFKPIGF